MKICFLSSMHSPQDKRVFEKEAVSLAEAGFAVMHICPGLREQAGTFRGIEILTYPRRRGLWGRIRNFRTLYRLGKNVRADVYHCNEVDSWLIGLLLKIVTKKGCVFDVHEHYPSTFAESRFPVPLRPVVSTLIKCVLYLLTPLTDYIVVAKRSVIADFPVRRERLVIVQNFTPLEGVGWAAERSSTAADHDVTLVHLGLFSKVRGWPQVLEALAVMRARNVRLEIVGEFNDGSHAEFLERAAELGVSERINIREWMPFREAFRVLCSADVGLVTFQPGILNHVYAMPHKIFDYMAAGLAVVCPKFALEIAPIVAESGCGILVDPSDPNALAAAFDELVASPAVRYGMGRRGRSAVRERYNWEAEATKLVSLYRNWEGANG
jgi:glycosyltransferase involved in cell wall biosynthesis